MPKRILTGKVTSNKSDKTITVIVERKIMHPMYKKFVTNFLYIGCIIFLSTKTVIVLSDLLLVTLPVKILFGI